MRIRMYVLEGLGADPWTTNFTWKSQLDTYNQFAIDGTYFQHSTGLYHIYSCWYREFDGWPSNLCITQSKLLKPLNSPKRNETQHANFPIQSVKPLHNLLQLHRTHHPLRPLQPLGNDTLRKTQHPLQPAPLLQRRPRTTHQPSHRPKLCHLLRCTK